MKFHGRFHQQRSRRTRVARSPRLQTKEIQIKRKISICVKQFLWYTSEQSSASHRKNVHNPSVLVAADVGRSFAQERTVDATWLHRYLPELNETKVDLSSATCHYKPIFGTGDPDNRILRSVSRFGELRLNLWKLPGVFFDREEAIYFFCRAQAVCNSVTGCMPCAP